MITGSLKTLFWCSFPFSSPLSVSHTIVPCLVGMTRVLSPEECRKLRKQPWGHSLKGISLTVTHTDTYTQTHTRTHTCTHTRTYTHRHRQTHTRAHARTSIDTRTHARTNARTHARTHTHTNIGSTRTNTNNWNRISRQFSFITFYLLLEKCFAPLNAAFILAFCLIVVCVCACVRACV